jgi:hypothetical protein
MIIVDNSVLSFAFQIENGIPILPYYDKDDLELKFLSNYLNSIHNVKDLRIENNRSIKMLYFLNTVKEKIIGKNIDSNNINNYSSYESEENKIYEINYKEKDRDKNNNNNNNFFNNNTNNSKYNSNNNYINNTNNNNSKPFNINLISPEKIIHSESSYFESDNSNSHIFDSEQSNLKISQYENFSSENSNSEYLESNNFNINGINNNSNGNYNINNSNYSDYSNLQDILHDTLDDLRTTFLKDLQKN